MNYSIFMVRTKRGFILVDKCGADLPLDKHKLFDRHDYGNALKYLVQLMGESND